jgi:hypothetical protein
MWVDRALADVVALWKKLMGAIEDLQRQQPRAGEVVN